MSDDFYFQDYCIEAGVEQCHFCGIFVEAEEFRLIHVDDPGNLQPVCLECIESMEASC